MLPGSDDIAHGRLSVIRAEQRKVDSLKYMNVPWVFVEPTRINFAKVPRKKKQKKIPEGFDEDELSFLKQSDLPFTDEDFAVLRQSLHGEKLSAETHTQDFEDALAEIRRKHEETEKRLEIESLKASSQNLQPERPEDFEDLLTPRDETEADLFGDMDEACEMKNEEYQEKEEIPEPDEIKTLIMEQVKEKSRPRREEPRQIKLFQFDIEKNARDEETAKEKELSKGRLRIIKAIEKTSALAKDQDSLTLARKKHEKESALKRAALEKCFGAKHFRDYLEKNNHRVPSALSDMEFKVEQQEQQQKKIRKMLSADF